MQTIVLYDVNHQLYKSLIIMLDLSGPHLHAHKDTCLFPECLHENANINTNSPPPFKTKGSILTLCFVLCF